MKIRDFDGQQVHVIHNKCNEVRDSQKTNPEGSIILSGSSMADIRNDFGYRNFYHYRRECLLISKEIPDKRKEQ